MPHINPNSLDVGHGVGGGRASINNQPFSSGGFGGWVDRDIAAYVDGSANWTVQYLNSRTGVVGTVFSPPLQANTVFAGGGVVAAHQASNAPERGLHSTTGLSLPNAGLLGVGPDGSICYKPDYQSNGPSIVRELDHTEWQLTPGHAASLQLLGERKAVWMEGMLVGTAGLPGAEYITEGGIWGAKAVFAAGKWWLAYYSGSKGIILHPFESSEYCYSILPKGDGWFDIASVSSDIVRIAISKHEGEQPGDIWGYDLNVQTGFALPLSFGSQEQVSTSFPFIRTAFVNPPTHNDIPHGDVHNDAPHNDAPHADAPVHTDAPHTDAPHTDIPPPSSEDEVIAYAPPVPGFLAGDEVDNGNGTVSIKKPNGKFLCVTPDGKVEERDTPGGVWESFKKGKASLIAERDGGPKGVLVYVLPLAE